MNVTDTEPTAVSRRTVLRGALAAGAAVAATPILSACGGSGGSSRPGGAGVPLPSYRPATGPQPDLPGTEFGVQPGFFNYPKDLVTTVPTKPGSGQPLSAMVVTYNPPASGSRYTAAVNDALGAPVNLIYVPEPEYATRFATVVAGDELPELIQLPLFANLPLLADFLRSKCVDLSDKLSGTNVDKYPNLAAIPPSSWRNARIGGRIYGVPVARNVFNRATFYRKDILQQHGVTPPNNADEFLQLCRSLTNAGQGRYALGGFASGAINPLVLILISGMFRVPNQWRKDGNRLVYYIETDEFKQSVAYTRKLWEAGVFHPDSPSMKQQAAQDLFGSGRIAILENGNPAWLQTLQTNVPRTPGFAIDAIPAFGHDGGKPTWWLKEGAFSYTVIPKAAQGRVDELLGIMNYCAAPFGSVEYDLLRYGKEGTHHARKPNGPQLTALGKKEVYLSYLYLAATLEPLFSAEFTDTYTKPLHAWETRLAEVGIEDPAVGHYSATASRNNANLKTLIDDEITNVVVGRKDLKALDELVTTWRNRGGEQIRAEYQQALEGES